jgi:DNA-binding response OmpR family regulator
MVAVYLDCKINKHMKQILLIFNDLNEAVFISENLKENGYEVVTTSNISTASAMIQEKKPDLVVIDIPGGESDINLFSDELKKKNIKSLLLASSETISRLNQHEDKEHYIVSPLRPKVLLSAIRAIMEKEELNWLPAKS